MMSKYLVVGRGRFGRPRLQKSINSRDLGNIVDGFLQIFKIEDNGKVFQVFAKADGKPKAIYDLR